MTTKKKTTVKTSNDTPSKPQYGMLVYRDGPGWRTDYIEVVDGVMKVVGSHEPDMKDIAFAVGESFINQKTFR